MRPPVLFPLFASATSLAGIGPRMQLLLKKALRLPPGVTSRASSTCSGIRPRASSTAAPPPPSPLPCRAPSPPWRCACSSTARRRPATAGAPYKVALRGRDRPHRPRCSSTPIRAASSASSPRAACASSAARIDAFNDEKQMAHPDYIVRAGGARRPADARAGLSADRRPLGQGAAARPCATALTHVPELPEWQDPAWLKGRGWPDWRAALACACTSLRARGRSRPDRRPGSGWPSTSCSPASWRWGWCARASSSSRGAASSGDGRIRARIAAALPFALTNSQRQALAEIAEDISAPFRMLRLLQGDVGSGKTVVALLAMAIAVEAGAQAALMAPTEVLARQHAETIAPLAEHAGLDGRRCSPGARRARRARRSGAAGRPARSTS